MLHKEQFSLDIAFEMVDIRRTGTVVLGDSEAALRTAIELKNRGVDHLILVTPDRSDDPYEPAESHFWYEATAADEEFRTIDGDIASALVSSGHEALSYLEKLGVTVSDMPSGKMIAGDKNGKTVQALLKDEVKRLSFDVYEGYQVLRYLVSKKQVVGVFLLNSRPQKKQAVYKVLLADNVVIGTGGPTSVYLNTTYLTEKSGTYGLAILAGAKAKNAAEWRFGIAAKDAPLRVTRALLEALPRVYSVDAEGVEHDFLKDRWQPDEVMRRLQEKARHWAFDIRQKDGAGAIDLLIKKEEDRGRDVYLDYRSVVYGESETPLERLLAISQDAYDAFLAAGIDLKAAPLSIHLAAGHHIGGLEIDDVWQTSFEGLYAVGEAAAVYGGDHEVGKLSAGQIGAIRAATHIAETRNNGLTKNHIDRPMRELVREFIRFAKAAVDNDGQSAIEFERDLQEKLSAEASVVREKRVLQALERTLTLAYRKLDTLKIDAIEQQGTLIHTLNTLYAQSALVFSALNLFVHETGSGTGSLYLDGDEDVLNTYDEEEPLLIQEIWFEDEQFHAAWRELRPAPISLEMANA